MRGLHQTRGASLPGNAWAVDERPAPRPCTPDGCMHRIWMRLAGIGACTVRQPLPTMACPTERVRQIHLHVRRRCPRPRTPRTSPAHRNRSPPPRRSIRSLTPSTATTDRPHPEGPSKSTFGFGAGFGFAAAHEGPAHDRRRDPCCAHRRTRTIGPRTRDRDPATTTSTDRARMAPNADRTRTRDRSNQPLTNGPRPL